MLADLVAIRSISAKTLVTRWKPIDVLCEGNLLVRTKLVRDPQTAAVCVSEAVGREILRVIGLRVADGHAVVVSPEFAGDLSRQFAFDPPVIAGRHWGTTLLQRAHESDFQPDDVTLLKEPEHLFSTYVADILLANRDRRTPGNVLLVPTSATRRFLIVPIDQSDCFGHPADLRSVDRLIAIRNEPIANWLRGTELVVLDRPADFAADEVGRVKALAAPILESVNVVPDEWYERSGVSRQAVQEFLSWRLDHLDGLVDISYWENLANATGGGHVISKP